MRVEDFLADIQGKIGLVYGDASRYNKYKALIERKAKGVVCIGSPEMRGA